MPFCNIFYSLAQVLDPAVSLPSVDFPEYAIWHPARACEGTLGAIRPIPAKDPRKFQEDPSDLSGTMSGWVVQRRLSGGRADQHLKSPEILFEHAEMDGAAEPVRSFPVQRSSSESSSSSDDSERYEIAGAIDDTCARDGTRWYLCLWEGHRLEDATWEPASCFESDDHETKELLANMLENYTRLKIREVEEPCSAESHAMLKSWALHCFDVKKFAEHHLRYQLMVHVRMGLEQGLKLDAKRGRRATNSHPDMVRFAIPGVAESTWLRKLWYRAADID